MQQDFSSCWLSSTPPYTIVCPRGSRPQSWTPSPLFYVFSFCYVCASADPLGRGSGTLSIATPSLCSMHIQYTNHTPHTLHSNIKHFHTNVAVLEGNNRRIRWYTSLFPASFFKSLVLLSTNNSNTVVNCSSSCPTFLDSCIVGFCTENYILQRCLPFAEKFFQSQFPFEVVLIKKRYCMSTSDVFKQFLIFFCSDRVLGANFLYTVRH